MTREQMHKEFKLLMDKAGEGGSPSFTVDEIDRFLNMAQDRFVTKRAFGNNPRRTGFEEDQKRRDDLRTLINESQLTVVADSDSNKPNGKFYTLPSDYRYSVQEEAFIMTDNAPDSGRRVSVKPITHDRYNKIINDPFNKPDKDTVYRLGYGGNGNHVELICGENQSVSTYYLRYLKNPTQIGFEQNCTLAEHTHREIIRMAVVDALETVEQPRYQSSKIELNEIE